VCVLIIKIKVELFFFVFFSKSLRSLQLKGNRHEEQDVKAVRKGLHHRFVPRNDNPHNDPDPKTHTALGIAVESPERGTSEDLERKARPEGERPKTNEKLKMKNEKLFFFAILAPSRLRGEGSIRTKVSRRLASGQAGFCK
jgi:hypothetical protein